MNATISPIPPASSPALLSVGALVTQLGRDTVIPLGLDAGADGTISGTELCDVGEPLSEPPGTLLLVLSSASLPMSELLTLAEQAQELGYAGIALKCQEERVSELEAVALGTGVPILRVAQHISWRYFDAEITRALGEQRVSPSDVRHSAFEPLFVLANEVAERFGGSVVFEDLSRHIVGYSSVPGQRIDELRTAGILTRRVPVSPFNDEQYRLVLGSEHSVRFPQLGDELPRIALAIRAGSTPLGTLWAIDGADARAWSLEDEQLLAEIVRRAAAHMLDSWRVRDANTRPREDRLRRLLSGSHLSGTELAELGMPEHPGARLLCFAHPALAGSPSALAQARQLVSSHLVAYRPDTVVVSHRGHIFALGVAADLADAAALSATVLPLLDRALGGVSRAAVSDEIRHSSDLAHQRLLLERMMRCTPHVPEPLVVHEALVRPQLLLLGTAELLEHEPSLNSPALDELWQGETTRVIAETLLVWCRTQGNVARTAQELGVHENTVRHRVRRAHVDFGVPLSTPDEVLATWVQLRALAVADAVPERRPPSSSTTPPVLR